MSDTGYRISFTAGGLLLRDSIAIARLFQEQHNWDAVKQLSLSSNVLQARTLSTSRRVVSEVCLRLRHLHDDELKFLINGSKQDQLLLLWIAVCRTYEIIAEFTTEVLWEKVTSYNYHLEQYDFDYFFNKKSELHAELSTITTSTRLKLRQVLFKMLREASIISNSATINQVILSPDLKHITQRRRSSTLRFIPFVLE